MSILSHVRSSVHQILLLALWFFMRRQTNPRDPPERSNCAVLVPPDPATLVDSRGDEAMLLALTTRIRQDRQRTQCQVATTNPKADTQARTIGLTPFRVWGGALMPLRFNQFLATCRPAMGFVMGADVMDGHYSPVNSLRMIIAADLLARWGARTAFVGFSFNEHPSRVVRHAFKKLHPDVRVNLRDPLSWQRFRRVSGRKSHLVADLAFLLEPAIELSPTSAAVRDWMQQRRAAGQRVMILNLHPMVFSSQLAPSAMPRLLQSMQQALTALTGKYALSWLLLPHDNRPHAGDGKALESLALELNPSVREQILLVKQAPSAPEIKAIAGLADGAITGRMHLAIAALGQSTPVMVLAYQDKFAGLMMQFGMPDWLLMDGASATNPERLTDVVERFVNALPDLRSMLHGQLPAVRASANATLGGMFEQRRPVFSRPPGAPGWSLIDR